MVEIAPGSEYLKLAGSAALVVNRPAEAVRHYERAESAGGWLQEWKWHWTDLTRAYHMLGDHERELELARRRKATHPRDVGIREQEMRALAALDRIEELQAVTAEVRRSEDPGKGDALAYAAAELTAHGHERLGRELFRQAIEAERARLGMKEDALDRERVIRLLQERARPNYYWLPHAPTLWSLRDYPPFQELVRPEG